MNLSTRLKFTLLVFSALGLLAIATGTFTAWRVREAISEKLRENSANAVLLSAANASDLHKSLFLRKIDQVLRLKAINNQQEATIRSFANADGDLFSALGRLALPEGYSILATDDTLKTLFRYGDFPADFDPYRATDIKGRAVGPTMLALTLNNTPASVLVRRETAKGTVKLFGHHFYLVDRKLLIGLWTDIAPQMETERRELANGVKTLSATFGGIRLGSSGFLMAVDEDGAQVITPGDTFPGPDMAALNLLTGNTLLEDVKRAAAESSSNPFHAEASWLGDGRSAIFFVQRVRSLKWYIIGVGFVDEIEATGRRLSLALSVTILAIAAGLTVAAALMVGKLTDPLARLAVFAREISKTDFFLEAEKNALLDELSRRPSRDEIGELARALSFMDTALRARVREIVDTAGKRERMEGELHAATQIQRGFLPHPIPEAETRGRFRLAAELTPAREVGGDLYDFFMLDENRLCVVIGDVSGKGVPAALFMSMTMILLRSGAEEDDRLESMLSRINRNLSRDNVNQMFVTLFMAVLDMRTGELRYANGGHNYPHIVSATGVRRLDDASGPLVGVFEEAVFSGGMAALEPGETLFLHTDGVNEAMNAANEEFGEAALESVLLESRDEDPQGMIRRMKSAIAKHVAGAPASDDLTMLCLRREPAAPT